MIATAMAAMVSTSIPLVVSAKNVRVEDVENFSMQAGAHSQAVTCLWSWFVLVCHAHRFLRDTDLCYIGDLPSLLSAYKLMVNCH
jgi:hypothetical protein